MGWAEQCASGRFRAMIRVGNRRRNATPGRTYPTEAEARRIAGREEDEQRRPGARNPASGRMTWGQWAPVWWAQRRVEGSTRTRDESRMKVHVAPRWERVPLEDIDRAAVQGWVRDLEESGLAASTVRSAFNLLSSSLKAAVLDRRLVANPCTSITLPARPPADERYLSHDEVEAVAFFLDEPWRTLMMLLAGTGMRWGELAALHRHRVHLDAHRIDVTLAWDIKNRDYKLPKDHEKRSIPVLDWVGDLLEEHLRVTPGRSSCGVAHPARVGQRCSSSLVLAGRGGVPVDYDSFRRNHWEPAVGRWVWQTPAGTVFRSAAEAGAAGAAETERVWEPGMAGITEPVTLHDLRHTFASWFLHAGGAVEELKDILGHSSVIVTERYAHLQRDRFSKIRERMAGLGPGAVAPVVPAEEAGNVRPLRKAR